MMKFLIHNFERRTVAAEVRQPILPCTDWIDVECVDCGTTWIAAPGQGPGTYQCVGMCEGLEVACRHCGRIAQVPVPR